MSNSRKIIARNRKVRVTPSPTELYKAADDTNGRHVNFNIAKYTMHNILSNSYVTAIFDIVVGELCSS